MTFLSTALGGWQAAENEDYSSAIHEVKFT